MSNFASLSLIGDILHMGGTWAAHGVTNPYQIYDIEIPPSDMRRAGLGLPRFNFARP